MLPTKNRPLNVALWSLCVAGVLASGAAFAQSQEPVEPSVMTPSHSAPFPIPEDVRKQLKRTGQPKSGVPVKVIDAEPGVMGQPMLPGATNSTIGPQGEDATDVMGTTAPVAPMLQGETNGTIGPPASPMATVPTPLRMESIPTRRIGQAESAAIIGAALGCLGLSMFFLIKKKKAAFWTLGALAAAILAIAGFAWGTFGMFQ